MEADSDPTRFCPACQARIEAADGKKRSMTYTCGSHLRIINDHRQDFRRSVKCKSLSHSRVWNAEFDEMRSLMES